MYIENITVNEKLYFCIKKIKQVNFDLYAFTKRNICFGIFD